MQAAPSRCISRNLWLKAFYRGEARQDSLDDATLMLASQKTPLIF